jgi:hypothetical protein
LKQVFSKKRFRHNSDEIEHFDIPKLHSLAHYVTWINELGTLDSVNTLQMEVLHKSVKEA